MTRRRWFLILCIWNVDGRERGPINPSLSFTSIRGSGKHVDIAIGNNGDYVCDATAVRLRVYATDKRHETPGVDVTKKVQSVFQGKFKTDLGKYADLFGYSAPGQEKTLKLRVQDVGGNIKYLELPQDAPIEL